MKWESYVLPRRSTDVNHRLIASSTNVVVVVGEGHQRVKRMILTITFIVITTIMINTTTDTTNMSMNIIMDTTIMVTIMRLSMNTESTREDYIMTSVDIIIIIIITITTTRKTGIMKVIICIDILKS